MTVASAPLVSVVVPCKDRAAYLRSTLESIFQQSYPNIECIVVDGGSTDGTVELLQGLGDKVRWVSEPDRGAFDAINKGWKLSRGEILAWLNADDEWVVPGAVSAAVSYLVEHPEVDLVYGDCGGIDAEGRLVWYGPARDWDLRRAVLFCDHMINQPAAFVRRSAVESVGGLYPAWGHDHDLWVRLALAGHTLKPVPVHLADARVWAGNAHMSPGLIIPAKIGTIERALADPRLPVDLRRQRGRVLSNAYVRCLDFLPTPRHWRYVPYLLAKAFLADPTNIPYIAKQLLVHIGWVVPSIRRRLRAGFGHGVEVGPDGRKAAGFAEEKSV